MQAIVRIFTGRPSGLSFPGALVAFAAAAGLVVALAGCGGEPQERVVVYTSTDQVRAARVMEMFEKETGIRVDPLYDTEAQKTTGLAMRLLEEKERPKADVFWNNELSRTLMLAEEGVFEPYKSPSAEDIGAGWKAEDGLWAGISWRARVIVYNTEMVGAEEAPRTLEELAGEKWENKVAVANPLFGTTATHAAALADALGEEAALDCFRRLRENGAQVFEGNSSVRDAVVNGEVPVGLTDTDDAIIGKNKGMPIELVYPDQGEDGLGTLVIPNSVVLINGAPHPEVARRFIDFLLSPELEKEFADPAAGRFPVRPGLVEAEVPDVKAMEVDWAEVARMTADFSERATRILTQQEGE